MTLEFQSDRGTNSRGGTSDHAFLGNCIYFPSVSSRKLLFPDYGGNAHRERLGLG
jgi:hypothetical protein